MALDKISIPLPEAIQIAPKQYLMKNSNEGKGIMFVVDDDDDDDDLVCVCGESYK